MKGNLWKKTDDLFPLLIIDEKRILKLRTVRVGCPADRIYELSEALSVRINKKKKKQNLIFTNIALICLIFNFFLFQLDALIVSKYCSKHPFLLEMEPQLFQRKLKLILEFNVIHPEALLRDIDIFRRSEELLIKRFTFLRAKGVGRFLPWMFKSSNNIVARFVQ